MEKNQRVVPKHLSNMIRSIDGFNLIENLGDNQQFNNKFTATMMQMEVEKLIDSLKQSVSTLLYPYKTRSFIFFLFHVYLELFLRTLRKI